MVNTLSIACSIMDYTNIPNNFNIMMRKDIVQNFFVSEFQKFWVQNSSVSCSYAQEILTTSISLELLIAMVNECVNSRPS